MNTGVQASPRVCESSGGGGHVVRTWQSQNLQKDWLIKEREKEMKGSFDALRLAVGIYLFIYFYLLSSLNVFA